MNHHQITINESDPLVDSIVKEVLFRLGACQKIYVIKGYTYPQEWLDEMTHEHLIKWCDSSDIQRLKNGENIKIFLPELSIRQMMAVINACPFDQVSEVLLKALIMGVKIATFEETIEILEPSLLKTPLTDRFIKSYHLLIKSGLIVQKVKEDAETQMCRSEQEAIFPKNIVLNHKLVTEKQLIELKDQGVESITLKMETILTPSAMDFIRINAIKIDRK